MKVYDLDSWKDFRPLIESIRERYGKLEYPKAIPRKNAVLFRGHADSDWPLSTTLERATDEEFTLLRYMNRVSRCHHELESFTGKKWDIPDSPELERQIKEADPDFGVRFPCYDFVVYLRHHGFPSPLLDWTTSPYVAAYFAFLERQRAERVAVYAYVEMPRGGKALGYSYAIDTLGPYVSTDPRHFAQKGWYTVATETEKRIFHPHSTVFDTSDDSQYLLIKITMPAGERVDVLKELGDYNIDHFTLFQTEDALVKALALKEFDLWTA